MKNIQRLFALCLALSMLFALCAGAQAQYSIAALKGPTAMGLVALMQRSEENECPYAFSIAASADAITPALIRGDIDMACVPANLASVLYNRTDGAVQVLAINTLGVLYIVENGDCIHSLNDLKGQTIAAAGKGATPEYALRYLLRANGIDPDTDVTIQWKNEHSECISALASGQTTIALLPQPFVCAAQRKLADLRMAIDLNAAWDALDNGSALITGVIIGRREVLKNHPEDVQAFLQEYAASVAWVNANTAEAAELIDKYSIVEAEVAERALPYCNIVCITGDALMEKLSGYLKILYEANPASIGDALPEDDFYFAA